VAGDNGTSVKKKYLVRRPVQSESIEVSLNEDIKSKEGRKMKQGHWVQKTTPV